MHCELFFDPQSHTERGVPLATVIDGLTRAMREREGTISSSLIMCVLRHLGPEAALEAVRQVKLPLPCSTTGTSSSPCQLRTVSP